jgi:predicted nucleic acid-binding protein
MSEFFQRPVVCNTSPVIALSKTGLGHLFTKLFPRVLTTSKVVEELSSKEAGDQALIEQTLSTFEILPTPAVDPLLSAILDPGEASILQLAKERGILSVVLDERRGRRVAMDVFGLEVAGTCALLLRARKLSLISEVGSALDRIISNGLFISDRLRAECLRLAGE